MMIKKISMMALLVTPLWAAQAVAQTYNTNPGSFAKMNAERNNSQANSAGRLTMPPDKDTPDSFKAYNLMIKYGQCAANTSTEKLGEALSSKANSSSERRLFEQAGQSCRGGKETAIVSLVRGVYAEGLYHNKMSGPLRYGPLKPTDPGFQKFMTVETEHNADRDANDRKMIAVTNCIVAQSPGIVDGILASAHGSKDEGGLMDIAFAMAPECAGLRKQQKLSRSFLRAFMADSAYRYAMFRTPALRIAAK